MECGGAVYAKVPSGAASALEEAILAVRQGGGRDAPLGVLAFDPCKHAFALVDRWGKSDEMPRFSEGPDFAKAAELQALSATAGEVVAFYEVEEGLLLGVYGAWKNGELVRGLEFSDGAWVQVQGEPQPWEAPLFAPEGLDQILQNARDDGRDEAPIKAAFAAGKITKGARWPRPDSMPAHIRDTLKGAPHGFQPWPKRKDFVKQPDAAKDARPE